MLSTKAVNPDNYTGDIVVVDVMVDGVVVVISAMILVLEAIF